MPVQQQPDGEGTHGGEPSGTRGRQKPLLLPASQAFQGHEGTRSSQRGAGSGDLAAAAAAASAEEPPEKMPKIEDTRVPGEDQDGDMCGGVQDLQSAIRDAVAKECEKLNSRAVTLHITRVMQKLGTRIDQLQRVNERIAAVKEQVDALEGGKYPPGVRPCAVGFSSPLWDIETLQETKAYGCEIQAGLSIRAAKEKLHQWHSAAQLQLDLKILHAQRGKFRTLTRRDNVISECTESLAATCSPLADLDLDLDTSDGTFGIQNDDLAKSIQSKASALYVATVQEAAKLKKQKQELAK